MANLCDQYVLPDTLLKWIDLYLQPHVNGQLKRYRINLVLLRRDTKDIYNFFKQLIERYDSPDLVYNDDEYHRLVQRKSYVAMFRTDLMTLDQLEYYTTKYCQDHLFTHEHVKNED